MKPNLWAKHYQNVWLQRASDDRFDYVWRCAALAYGLHAANGHAPLASGELASVLGKPGVPMDKRNVAKVVKKAKELGLLSPLSRARCLVVPQHAIGGPSGNPNASCPTHGEVITTVRPGRQHMMTDNALTCGNTSALLESVNSLTGEIVQ